MIGVLGSYVICMYYVVCLWAYSFFLKTQNEVIRKKKRKFIKTALKILKKK